MLNVQKAFMKENKVNKNHPEAPTLTQIQNTKIYFDGDCSFCKKTLDKVISFLKLNDVTSTPAQLNKEMFDDMKANNSWIVIDHSGNKHFKFDAMITLFKVSPNLYKFAPVLSIPFISIFGRYLYELVANNRRFF